MHLNIVPWDRKASCLYCVRILPIDQLDFVLSVCKDHVVAFNVVVNFIYYPLMGFTAVTQQCGIWCPVLLLAAKLSWMIILSLIVDIL